MENIALEAFFADAKDGAFVGFGPILRDAALRHAVVEHVLQLPDVVGRIERVIRVAGWVLRDPLQVALRLQLDIVGRKLRLVEERVDFFRGF